jgi:hypothetical protein
MLPSLLPISLKEKQFSVNQSLWFFITTSVVAFWASLYLVGITVKILIWPQLAATIDICSAISLFYRYIYRDDNMFFFGNAISQLTVSAFSITIGTYIGGYMALPLTDKALIAIDKTLGFDWQSSITLANNHPLLSNILGYIYVIPTLEIIAVICTLFFFKKTAHGQRFVIIYFFSGMVTCLLAALFPAVAGYVYYNVTPGQFIHLYSRNTCTHELLLMALRNHTIHSVYFPGIGLVTFPSFHAVMAILLIYGSLPLRYLRWIIIPTSIIMLYATIIHGGHWLVDIIGGVIITLTGIMIAEKILPSKEFT